MNNCNGRASYSTNYEPAPMRQPKSKDSVLSADAQEFVPSFRKAPIAVDMSANLGPPIPQQFIPTPYQQQQPQQHSHHHQPHPNHHLHHHQPHMNHNQNHHHQHHHHNQHHAPHNLNHQNHGGMNQRNYSVQNRLQQFNGSGGRQPPSQQQVPPQQQHHYQQGNHVRGVSNGVSGGASNINQAQQQLQQLSISQFDNNEGQNTEPTEAEIHALSFLIEIMEKLNSNPGKFEDYQKELTALYIEFSENHHVICNAIELIFTQSIDEQNFRYTGARLCRLLDSIDPSPESMFRHLLCCKLQYNDGEIFQYMTNETHKVRNTTLFLAELYIQLQNDGSRITSIANSIHHCISLLMKKKSPENIKCVCQTLKLCGYELDIDFPKETEDLMGQLNSCENTDVSTHRLLTSVMELRKNRWGRSEPIALSAPDPVAELSNQEFSNDPVFYGPDGKILTDEESAFLWNATSYPGDGFDDEEDNDPDALVEIEPEMDLEIQLAFKDFVSYQNHK